MEKIKAEGENSKLMKFFLRGKNSNIKQKPLKTQAKTQKILNQEPKIGALNANSVLCTNQALSPGFCALNLVNAQNLRALNPGTTVSACVARSFL